MTPREIKKRAHHPRVEDISKDARVLIDAIHFVGAELCARLDALTATDRVTIIKVDTTSNDVQPM